MSKNEIPVASHDGAFRAGDAEVRCAVLQGGRRILYLRSVLLALGKSSNPKRLAEKETSAEGVYQDPVLDVPDNIKPFIFNNLKESTKLIRFTTPKGQSAFAVEASDFSSLVAAYLRARRAGELRENQAHIAEACEVLQDAFAATGLVALIDEATGYKAERQEEKYSAIFQRLLGDPRSWQKTFQDELHEQMRRLKVPAPWGIRYRQFVYIHLPGGHELLEELDRKNPVVPGYGRKSGLREHKHHQLLTEDIGVNLLKEQLISVVALMKGANTYEEFMVSFHRAHPEGRDDVVKLLKRHTNEAQLALFGEDTADA